MFSTKRIEILKADPLARVDETRDFKPPHPLTRRETDVLRWLARGKKGSEIAALLGISVCTVRVHVRHITKKLEAANVPHAVALAFQLGILRAEGC